jgi:organic hydroperoxide reductase OsmC/OhrA
MSAHEATVVWRRDAETFSDGRYSRRHELIFDGGAVIAGSASPQVVRAPWSDPSAVDPEEAFVASLASCHMLWFLAIASKRGFVVDRYRDRAVGEMGRNAEGRLAILRVTLRPDVAFAESSQPTREQLDAMHEEAHQECFIANSVRTDVRCEAVYE